MHKHHIRVPIVYVIASLDIGGAEKQLFFLLKELNKELYRPYVITYKDGLWKKKIEKLGIPIKVIPFSNKISVFLRTLMQIKKINPQIVHTVGFTAGYMGRLAAILNHTNIIIASERSAVNIKSNLKLFAEKIISLFSNIVICNAFHSAAYYVEKGIISKDKVVVIRNGIDLQHYPFSSRRYNKALIAYIANFKSEKNHLMLIEAASKVVPLYPEVEFHLAGDGELRNTIETLINERGLKNNFVLHGYVDDIQRFLGHINIYVHVSCYEGMSNALIEAMACGLPCIATKTAGNTELIEDGENGFIVEQGDVNALADKIIEFIKDLGLFKDISNLARKKIEDNFSSENMAKKTEKIYRQELNKLNIP